MVYQHPEPIAIVGGGCRFPGESSTPSKLWQLLRQPQDIGSKIPLDRFNIQRFYHPDGTHHGTTNVQQSYFLSEDVRRFDAQFFNLPPNEAEAMDPQHRVLMETVYEAVESAGLTLEGLQGSDTAVYVGLMCNDYTAIQARDFDFLHTYGATGTAASNASSRVSYFFDWHGPSMTIDTACSSSLVSVHQAVQTLRAQTSRVAVAAGTNLLLYPLPYVSESKLNMLSPNGRSRMWDADADGYARGDGVAAVILKTLSSALEDGDHIDCIIRETGVNQDGRTKGITMPSAIAQASLIRDTYARAGLDLKKKDDRCQYFEAHGTGTPAGDPQEAEALSSAFFGGEHHDPDDILYVGSVKTVIGHTEGTAGVAGLLKACLALKYSTIPPNLLFDRLSPRVEPFYKHLRILTSPRPWPMLPDGTPRRASVNSFGFGGTNAHAILESYEAPAKLDEPKLPATAPSLVPFTFSATSEKSLIAVIKSWLSYLQANNSVDLRSLAYTLSCRRSALPLKAAFSATTLQQLCKKIGTRLQESSHESELSLGVRSSQGSAAILGVFTGQGAQWATMGSKLVLSNIYAHQMIEELDQSLATLPENDRPQWTLMEELLADTTSSRLGEATISQPLCIAIQIVLVNLLHGAGIRFKAVIGHSSGEIAAAYAAGFISASDAVRIAYYRGLHAKLASGAEGQRGAMIAVGTSFEDAKEFCKLEDFEGRLAVAASNSSSSVTISGDADAIEQARVVFDEEQKFARILKVDTAYHSHHMLLCSDSYTESLRACNFKVLTPAEDGPIWFSSVRRGSRMEIGDDLKALYWVDNMTHCVLFSQALESALEDSSFFDIALEVGPHPALKGPVTQTIQEVNGKSIPYSGTLNRGKHDVESFSDALGFVWTSLGNSAVDFGRLEKTFNNDLAPVSVLKDLPTYSWNHDRLFWTESRSAKLFRTQEGFSHELLGVRAPDGTDEEWRWQNVLKPKEVPWLSGHALQGQTVFPATGYIALAMEASMQIAERRAVNVIELCDLKIDKAIAIDDIAGAEILVTMTGITGLEQGSGIICAEFTSYSTVSKDSGKMVINASGRVQITLGQPSTNVLSPRPPPTFGMSEVDIDQFYSAMGELGYGYSGPFRAISTLRRKLGTASGTITSPPIADAEKALLFHPGMLDTSLQGMFAAFSAPGDGRLWALHAPTGIRRVTLVPSLCGRNMPEELSFDCFVTGARRNNITGDVDLFTPHGDHKVLEIDGISFVPFSGATPADDRHLFAEATWGVDCPDGELALGDIRATPEQTKKAYDCERVAFYYLRTLNESIDAKERANIGISWNHEALFDSAAHICDLVLAEKHPYARKEWIHDSHEQVCAIMDSYGDDADFNIMRAVGENLPSVIRGETTILEHMTKESRLDNYYKHALGFEAGNELITSMIAQLSHRYPHMNLLEIGAGTGGSTRGILSKLSTAFASYTYTDISSGFFEKAQEKFKTYANRMVFKTLDIEKDPTTQGFTEHAYDVVVASNVLHATKPLEQTLINTRRLLKPGGYLVLLEIVDNGPMRVGLVMGGLPGWWIGREDGRCYAPTISLAQWNSLLEKTGFSGIDTFTPLKDPLPFSASVFAAQAVNDGIRLLRHPLLSHREQIPIKDLVLVGGKTLETSTLIDKLEILLKPRCEQVIRAASLEDLKDAELPFMSTVLSLTDLDSPVSKGLTEGRWENLKKLLTSSRNVLWITRGYRCEEPYAAMTVGLCRSVIYELSQLRLQLLDIDHSKIANAALMAELLLRLQLTDQWEENGSQKDFLWTTEPELMIENEKLSVLRVVPQKAQNDRYNSAKRLITKNFDLMSSVVNLEWHDNSYVLREGKASNDPHPLTHSTVQVECSLLSSFQTPAGRLFLSLGIDQATGSKVLSVSEKNASTIYVPKAWSTPVDVGKGIDAPYLSIVTGYLSSQHILAMMPAGGTLVVHEPDPFLASLLSRQLAVKGSHVIYTTSNPDVLKKHWLYIHPRTPKRAIDGMLPKNVSLFLDLSTDSATVGGLGSRIAASLPKLCERGNASALIARESLVLSVAHDDEVSEILRKANSFAVAVSSGVPEGMPLQLVALRDVLSDTVRTGPLSIVDWRGESAIPTLVEPVEERKDLFENRKTYWMVGLAGDLGQSLCDWMISHGARYIVLTSRTPKVAEEWIRSHEAKGITIACLPGDITRREDLARVHSEICRNFPQIAGVANGALVLRDKAFANMDLETFQTVVRPKVDGTIYLSELFHENTLEFFIPFSSIVATMGNVGQSAYSAANCFMKSLITQRRRRGLAGSVIDISRVLGVGYVERETKAQGKLTEKQIERIMNVTMPMSESDLHQLFGEAVLAGRPDSGEKIDIITGIRTLTSEATNNVFWAANLKFSHFIRDLGDAVGEEDSKTARVPVKTQLLAAKDIDDMYKILKDALAAKLSFNLQLSDDEAIRDTMPLIELGVDSLVAVEVRTWFMQEAGVDLPVLKILGGASIADLVNDAMTKLPQDLLSRFEATSPAESSDTSALSTESAPSANTLPSQVSPNGDEVVVEKELSMLIVGATKELAASVV